jgi:hypothetical protein
MEVTMGYAKQMLEIAQEWLRVNPDPKSPFLKVPGLDKDRKSRPEVLTAAEKLRYDALAKKRPEIAPYIEQIKDLDRQVTEERGLLHQHEADLEKALSSAPSPGQAKHVVHENLVGRWCLAWARSGYNLFDLSPDFVAAMLLTDARELDVDLVRLPFPAILIMMPDSFAIGAEGRSYTKIHVTEILGSDLRMLHAGDRVSAAISGLDPEMAHKILMDLQTSRQRASLLDRTGASLIGPSAQLRPSAQSGALHIYATDGVSVLDTLIDRKDLTWDAFDDLPDAVTDDADKRARQTLRQIVFGMLAYANAIDRAVEPRFPGAQRPASSKPHVTQWTVGRTVRINPVLVQMARGGNREAMFRLKHRFIVRGHYRNQAHGPQRTLRTSRWITPFFKGPEEGAMLVHTYKLDDPGDTSS